MTTGFTESDVQGPRGFLTVPAEASLRPSPTPLLLAQGVIMSYPHYSTECINVDHIQHQIAWSTETFGPGVRLGVLDHIRKELAEIEEDPTDLTEWVDVIILAFDGAWRGGHDPIDIIDAIKAKQSRNEARTWPDWRTADRDKAIEHVREVGS